MADISGLQFKCDLYLLQSSVTIRSKDLTLCSLDKRSRDEGEDRKEESGVTCQGFFFLEEM